MVKKYVQDKDIPVFGRSITQVVKSFVKGKISKTPSCSCCGNIIGGVSCTNITKYDWLCRTCTIDMWLQCPTFLNKKPDMDKGINIKELRKVSSEEVK